MTNRERNIAFINEAYARPAGVFCIENIINGKKLIGSGKDIKAEFNRYIFELKHNTLRNEEMQNDFNKYGEIAFEFNVVELIDRVGKKEDYYENLKAFLIEENELHKLAKVKADLLIEEIKPFGEKGYNKEKKPSKLKEIENLIQDKKNLESELFLNATIEELKNGYKINKDNYTCIICREKFEDGVIYKVEDKFYEAKKMIKMHIKEDHNSTFDTLCKIDKKYNGLSEVQIGLLQDFNSGLTDDEIANKTNTSKSTIRNHRFRLKEKQRQAKIFLALMSLMEEKENDNTDDNRSNEDPKGSNEKVVGKYVNSNGVIERMPKKKSERVAIYKYIASKFGKEMIYTEEEVNSIIKKYNEDYSTIRRELVTSGLIERETDGSLYWTK